jgi:hypothetical protein
MSWRERKSFMHRAIDAIVNEIYANVAGFRLEISVVCLAISNFLRLRFSRSRFKAKFSEKTFQGGAAKREEKRKTFDCMVGGGISCCLFFGGFHCTTVEDGKLAKTVASFCWQSSWLRKHVK